MNRRRNVNTKEKEKLLQEDEVHIGMKQELIQIIEHANNRQLDLILRIARKVTYTDK